MEIAVSDGGGPTVPEINQPASSAVGGRGLGIVQRLSLRWGVRTGAVQDGDDRDDRDGAQETTVWAEIAVHFDGAGESASEPEGAHSGRADGAVTVSPDLVIASSRDA